MFLFTKTASALCETNGDRAAARRVLNIKNITYSRKIIFKTATYDQVSLVIGSRTGVEVFRGCPICNCVHGTQRQSKQEVVYFSRTARHPVLIIRIKDKVLQYYLLNVQYVLRLNLHYHLRMYVHMQVPIFFWLKNVCVVKSSYKN